MAARRAKDEAGFSVDTHLFRELGELLVGRDSTALIELVKNAYDADATSATVLGTDLGNPEAGVISIVDDGIGMTEREFRDGFLRIASRVKDTSSRRSLLFGRRFTGEKGVGRLAAHKLARVLSVVSHPHADKLVDDPVKPYRIIATIDWDEVERHETLEDASAAISLRRENVSKGTSGTTIELRRLRRPWGDVERLRFFDEMSTFEPPPLLSDSIPRRISARKLLFAKPLVRDANGSGMAVKLAGDLEAGDDPASQFGGLASWILEIDAGSDGVQYAIAPTVSEQERLESPIDLRQFSTPRADAEDPPICFQARVLIATTQPPRALRETLRRTSGVRVYLEGFRVLPYGEPGDDWLEIQRNYVTRSRSLDLGDFGDVSKDEGLSRPPVDQVFGAVFLTEARAPDLQLLVNREGFVPGHSYDDLRTVLKRGVDLATRVRAEATTGRRAKRSIERRRSQVELVELERAPAERLQAAIEEAGREAEQAHAALNEGNADEARARIQALTRGLEQSREASEALISQAAMQRALASLGTQMAEFVHELNEILGSANALDELASDLVEPQPPTPAELDEVATAIGELRRALERQAILLVDVIAPDARRRRSRQRLADRFDAAAAFVRDSAARRGVSVLNEIPGDLRSPPMFPAEIATVMTNLLTNAVKAAGAGGFVRGFAERRGESVVLTIENTGASVDVGDAEQWFAPFASTTAEVDPALGQGLGLGLTLTRAMLAPYNSRIAFVEPSGSFATAIEVTFPE